MFALFEKIKLVYIWICTGFGAALPHIVQNLSMLDAKWILLTTTKAIHEIKITVKMCTHLQLKRFLLFFGLVKIYLWNSEWPINHIKHSWNCDVWFFGWIHFVWCFFCHFFSFWHRKQKDWICSWKKSRRENMEHFIAMKIKKVIYNICMCVCDFEFVERIPFEKIVSVPIQIQVQCQRDKL